VLFQLVKELGEKLGRHVVSLFVLVFRKGFEHSHALIFAEGAHLAHFVYFLQDQSRREAETHEASDNYADVLPQVRFEPVDDVSLDLHQFALI